MFHLCSKFGENGSTAEMKTVRLYDPAREPHGWMQIIKPSEFAVFATLADSGVPCDASGTPTTDRDAVCLIFGRLADAEAFCRERVLQLPQLQFDIFDADGRRKLPLMTVVHPSRAATREGSERNMRRNTVIAAVLLASGPVMIWFDWTYFDGVQVLPTIAGINAILIGARLVLLNAGHRSAERARRARVQHALADGRDDARREHAP